MSDLSTYLNEIGRYPVLTKEVQLLHCRRIHTWVNWPGGRDAAPRKVARSGKHSMDTMLRTNLRLVVAIARKYQNRGLEMADLIQEGSLGLIRGLELYDPSRGYAISTYAYWWVRQGITRALHTQARTIRLPINTHETLSKILSFVAEFTNREGRGPTHPEIAQALDLPVEKVTLVLDASTLTSCCSLDVLTAASNESTPLLHLIPNTEETTSNSPDRSLEVSLDTDFIRRALHRLPEIEATIIRSIFLDGMTMIATADKLNMTRAKVMQLRANGLRKLRYYMRFTRFVEG